jgi:hypothetical protein
MPRLAVSPASIASAVGNAAFADAVASGRMAPQALSGLMAGGGLGASALAPSVRAPLLGSAWRDVPMPGSDRALARRLEHAAAPYTATLSRTPGRCSCGRTAGPDGMCAECRSQPSAGGATATLARNGNETQGIQAGDERLEDPGFLICTAFCYLGIPPSMFKDIIAGMLEAAYEHFRATDASTSRRQFDAFRQELAGYSKVRLLAKAFRFLVTGELGLGIVIRAAGATAVRERILAMLARAGLRTGGLVAAEQIVRKAVLFIDLAITAGCGAYCGATAGVRALLEVTEAASQGLSEALRIMQGIGAAVGQLVSDMLANAYGTLDPGNWRVSGTLQGSAGTDVRMLGTSLFAQIRPGGPWRQRTPDQSEADAFLANVGRPIASFTTPYVQQNLLPSIATAAQRALGGPSGTAITGAMLGAMTPLGLAVFLRDNGLITFVQDPIAYATAELSPAPEAAAP